MISKEYSLAIALVLGSILKLFGIELPNTELETIVIAVASLWIAYSRFKKGDINALGIKK